MRLVGTFFLLIIGTFNARSQTTKKLLFEFDEVIHYKYGQDKDLPSWNARFKLLESHKMKDLRWILYSNTPKTLSDSNTLISSLDIASFVKDSVLSEKYDSLRNSFSVRDTNVVSLPSRCVPIYRDILIFKNNGQIVCITKLCMKCRHSYFVGEPNLNTQFFGQHGEWDILKKVLRYEREPTLWELQKKE